VSEHGDIAAGFAAADQVFAQRYDTGFVHNAQLEPRCALAHWQGQTLTLYTPSQGIANCRHDMARDLGLEDHQVRVVCHYMGGGFGNKNQNQDADLIAATLARHTNAPVML
jgi:xanthine dehydrogenase YagR molybdenum-binding subunit